MPGAIGKTQPNNRVYLNYRSIASLMVISRNTVAKVVKELHRRGELSVEKNYISFPVECELRQQKRYSLH